MGGCGSQQGGSAEAGAQVGAGRRGGSGLQVEASPAAPRRSRRRVPYERACLVSRHTGRDRGRGGEGAYIPTSRAVSSNEDEEGSLQGEAIPAPERKRNVSHLPTPPPQDAQVVLFLVCWGAPAIFRPHSSSSAPRSVSLLGSVILACGRAGTCFCLERFLRTPASTIRCRPQRPATAPSVMTETSPLLTLPLRFSCCPGAHPVSSDSAGAHRACHAQLLSSSRGLRPPPRSSLRSP